MQPTPGTLGSFQYGSQIAPTFQHVPLAAIGNPFQATPFHQWSTQPTLAMTSSIPPGSSGFQSPTTRSEHVSSAFNGNQIDDPRQSGQTDAGDTGYVGMPEVVAEGLEEAYVDWEQEPYGGILHGEEVSFWPQSDMAYPAAGFQGHVTDTLPSLEPSGLYGSTPATSDSSGEYGWDGRRTSSYFQPPYCSTDTTPSYPGSYTTPSPSELQRWGKDNV
ncbi:hypothetical protein LTR36_005841 [Oleoguttula mirabilis]|uniref:Uncharacterized protein n=1 Tax=Oleoguttula mirabilis TaxID=1507867 RepID=A0AAV9JF03_9PEZI|nr:hypothetical protein LTR36_005841 [Oleoguttula mirabilis]